MTILRVLFISDPAADGGSDSRRAPRPGGPPKPSLLKTILKRLQDNRLEGGDEEMARKLREINRVADDASYAVLKKVLNIIFVSTGFSLLFAVIFVIIYTAIGKRFLGFIYPLHCFLLQSRGC